MQHRRTSSSTDSASVLKGARPISEVLLELTVLGAKLFSDDHDDNHDSPGNDDSRGSHADHGDDGSRGGFVPCGLLFKGAGHDIRFCSASSTITRMYTELDTAYPLGEGPAPRALNAPTLQVADDTSDPTYPPFFRITASYGFSSILSVPLDLGDAGVAAITFYARPVGFFTPDKRRSAMVFAEQALRTIDLTRQLAHLTEHLTQSQNLTDGMLAAMESRTSIDLAIGIIMAQNRCSQDDAFGILQQASNTRNTKLREVANVIVEQAGGSTPRLHFTP